MERATLIDESENDIKRARAPNHGTWDACPAQKPMQSMSLFVAGIQELIEILSTENLFNSLPEMALCS